MKAKTEVREPRRLEAAGSWRGRRLLACSGGPAAPFTLTSSPELCCGPFRCSSSQCGGLAAMPQGAHRHSRVPHLLVFFSASLFLFLLPFTPNNAPGCAVRQGDGAPVPTGVTVVLMETNLPKFLGRSQREVLKD